MYDNILVPADFAHDQQTIESLQKAEKLASNGKIILLHVLDEIPAYALAELPDYIESEHISSAKDSLQAIADKAGVKVQVEVRKGGSYANIIESAKVNNAGLIIVSSHRPGLKDYLLGSTAAKVVRHAQCPVLVER